MAKVRITADIAAFSIGSIVLAGLAGQIMTADHGAVDWLLNGHGQPMLLGLFGLALVLLPLARRVLQQVSDPLSATEFGELARSLRRVGMANRVQTINLYLADQSDEAWQSIFKSRRELWDWLGEAYRDEALRAQMRPAVARRIAEAGSAADRSR